MADVTKTDCRPARWMAPLVLAMLCGVAAYSDSFRGPFIFDDIDAIVNNPQVNRALTASHAPVPTTLSGRPVLRATFAIDYAIGGMRVEVYHLTNLLIHLASGVVLFAIVRQNLSSERNWGNRFSQSAHWLAGAVCAVWLVHPLNTEAVSYTVQRAESLAGLFYLLVIYCVIRNWKLAAVAACAMGLGTKEMVATAPLVALIYDRTFLSGSFAAALKARRGLYIALAATWVIPVAVTLSGSRSASVGGLLPLDYVRTQAGVIAHYVALSIWPSRLVLDYYDWPIVQSWGNFSVGALLVVVSILLFLISLGWKPWLGFLGIWFFLILAPSSSVLPIFTEIAAEHRMYLPIMAPVVLVVVGGWAVLARSRAGAWIAGLLLTILLAALSARTFLRNAEYQDPESIWADNVAQRPMNPRAHFNLGYTLLTANRPAEAAHEFRTALELDPNYYAADRELGRALLLSREANLEEGRLRAARGDAQGAEADFQAVTRPDGQTP